MQFLAQLPSLLRTPAASAAYSLCNVAAAALWQKHRLHEAAAGGGAAVGWLSVREQVLAAGAGCSFSSIVEATLGAECVLRLGPCRNRLRRYRALAREEKKPDLWEITLAVTATVLEEAEKVHKAQTPSTRVKGSRTTDSGSGFKPVSKPPSPSTQPDAADAGWWEGSHAELWAPQPIAAAAAPAGCRQGLLARVEGPPC